ncbi:mitochondrial inner membrane protease subunit 2 isoform X3 [Cimex lectularius]|uniref:Mitochondrial inner membrane protease subunit n=1 Tax=Cimex lectularius TaxID=79782 RepID=A0A8I6S0D2_CIMLE|nr:mitochondrial inner membrane protease subunit 2 isoform X3 [Cimex lectularius]
MTLADVLKSIAVAVPVGITIIDLLGYVARVDGVSMQPALNPTSENDYVFLNRLSLRFYEVSRGDVVALFSPKNHDQKIIKRVIGLEGDVINTLSYKTSTVRIPKGHCWVEGDNANHSMDSNMFGPIALALITAKATAVVWPPKRWQYVKSFVPESRIPANHQMEA